MPSVGTSRRYASLIPWRDNYVGVFITAGYATLLLSGKTTRQRGKDAIRRPTTKGRPCVELPITDLPLDDFDWFRGPRILGQLAKQKKSTHDRSLIIISCHALLLSLRRLPPLSLASCFSHANSYLSVRIADPTDRSEPTSGFLLVFEPLELEPGCGRPRKIHRSLHLAVVFVPCVHRQNYSPLRDDVAVFLLPALRRGSIYGVVEGRSSKEGGSLHVQRSRCGYRISDRRCEFETRADTMRLKKADPKSRDVARTRLLRP